MKKKVLELGGYNYNLPHSATLSPNRQKRPPTKIKHDGRDAVYDGEWIVNSEIREGYATLVLSSGLYIYHGWFTQN